LIIGSPTAIAIHGAAEGVIIAGMLLIAKLVGHAPIGAEKTYLIAVVVQGDSRFLPEQ
jgi:hypothetical protein